ncbi:MULTISPECIES: 3'-5' exonuclease [Serratia]|uniref:3'-5' exonuclease n=1 Tax=Serratia TaxID=613 RepID=UPI000661485F|nr:3'-5' exonuclease [Serratia sp. 506_PEND]
MRHIMLDLETMDNRPSAAIVAIGAVAFDLASGTLGKRFYQRVDLENSQKHGGTIGADTVKWWLRQSAEARSEIATDDAVTLGCALGELQCFIMRNGAIEDVRIWAKGTDFDLPIINTALASVGLTPVWRFWNARDVRTIEEAAKDAGMDLHTAVPFDGAKHNALDDAIHQAKTVIHIWKHLIAPNQQSLQS